MFCILVHVIVLLAQVQVTAVEIMHFKRNKY